MEYLPAWRFPLYCFLRLLRTPWQYFYFHRLPRHRRKKTKAAFLPWSHCLSGTAVTWVYCASVFLSGLAKALARSFSIMSCPALLLWYFAGSVRLCIWQLLWEASKMALEKRVLPSCKICLPWGSVWYLCCLQCRCLVSGDIYGGFWSAFSLFMLFFCPPSGGISLQYGRLRFKAGAGAFDQSGA